jgi:elongation factor Ts
MAEISAAAVKELRDQTGLPMMDCKRALTESEGDVNAAIQRLREKGAQVLAKRSDRDTTFGRFGLYTSMENGQGGMVELKCESASVTQNEEFIQLANDLAEQLATGPGAADGDDLLGQPSPSQDGSTLLEQRDELFNRIREVFNVGRLVRIDGSCASYSHNASTVSGVLLEVEGGNEEAARDICMHIAAMHPSVLEESDLPEDMVERERGILHKAALQEVLEQITGALEKAERKLSDAETQLADLASDAEGDKDPAAAEEAVQVATTAVENATAEVNTVELAQQKADGAATGAGASEEGKPGKIIARVDKMVDGRLRKFFAERVLTEQPFVKGEKQTVSQFAEEHDMKIKQFFHWDLSNG